MNLDKSGFVLMSDDLVRPARFERATSGFVDQCSRSAELRTRIGAGDRNRTCVIGLEDRYLSHSVTPALVFLVRGPFHTKIDWLCQRFLCRSGRTKVGLYSCPNVWSGQPATIRHLRHWRCRSLPIKLCPLKPACSAYPSHAGSNHIPELLKNHARRPMTSSGECKHPRKNWYAAPESNRDCPLGLLLLRQAGLPIPPAAHKSVQQNLVRRDGFEPPLPQLRGVGAPDLQSGALPLGQRRLRQKQPGAVKRPGCENILRLRWR